MSCEELVASGARPHEVAVELVDELRGRTPTVLVLEDVHWADEATLDVLTLLAHADRHGACADRSRATGTTSSPRPRSCAFVLGEIARRPGVGSRVVPLSPAAVAELAAPHGVDADELYRRTGGNPFFVDRGARGGRRRRCPTRCATRSSPVPRALTEPARRLLEAVAIVPGQVELCAPRGARRRARRPRRRVPRVRACSSPAARTSRSATSWPAWRSRRRSPPHRRLALHRPRSPRWSADGADAGAPRPPRRRRRRRGRRSALRAARRRAGCRRPARTARPPRSTRGRSASPTTSRRRRAPSCSSAAPTSAIWPPSSKRRSPPSAPRSTSAGSSATRAAKATRCARSSRLLFFAGRTAEAEPVVLKAVELLEPLPPSHELAMAYGNVAQRRMVVEDRGGRGQWGTARSTLAEAPRRHRGDSCTR